MGNVQFAPVVVKLQSVQSETLSDFTFDFFCSESLQTRLNVMDMAVKYKVALFDAILDMQTEVV